MKTDSFGAVIAIRDEQSVRKGFSDYIQSLCIRKTHQRRSEEDIENRV